MLVYCSFDLFGSSGSILNHLSPLMVHYSIMSSNASFVKGMSEFLEGEVSLICRKIILIHGQNPGVCYLEIKGFK